ncbi:carboxypeptidase-like regulatory domain-containing protein [Croceiramulus getboli]|nr:carboxypeptidase-like regulatory domain-containing protein [Flavobacteriaceae bacterium YJPT1-3]
MQKRLIITRLILILLPMFLLCTAIQAQNDQNFRLQGQVTYLEKPLPDASVLVEGTKRGTLTDDGGFFSIQVKPGDRLVISRVGFRPHTVRVSEKDTAMTIAMDDYSESLDEVTITAKKSSDTLQFAERLDYDFRLRDGSILNPKRSASLIHYMGNEELKKRSAAGLPELLGGRFSGVVFDLKSNLLFIRGVPAYYIIDGVQFAYPPAINFEDIIHLFILKQEKAVAVITKFNPQYREKLFKQRQEKLLNKNIYTADDQARGSLQAITELSADLPDRMEQLKAEAYIQQQADQHLAAIENYEEIFKQRPTYAQSYRDLANAYLEAGKYDRAWRLYMAYVFNHELENQEGIGEILYSEMEWLYFNKLQASKIKQTFEPIHENKKDFERDIRLVFEWTDSEAEFELEFVGPDQRVFNFEHSYRANSELLQKERSMGSSSKEFSIEDLGDQEWLVNLTYLGNNKSTPSYLKVTTYYDWGKPTQFSEVQVFPLEKMNLKWQLLKLSSNVRAQQVSR